MARIEQRMPPFEGVAAGQTAQIKLPIGRRYHHLFLSYTGVTLAQMTEIRILANAKVIHRYSAVERDAMNQFDGMAAAAGILQIPFDRMDLKNRDMEELTAINTQSRDEQGRAILSLTMEIDIASAATAPALDCYATQSDMLPGGPGIVMHVRKDSRSPAGAGEFDIADLPYNTPVAQVLNRVFFKPSTGTIDKVQIWRDNYNIWERKTALNTKVQTDGVRVPQSGYWVIDKTELGYGGEGVALRGVQDFRYKLDVSGAMQINCISEYLGQLGD